MPLQDEEDTLFEAHKENTGHANEYKTILHLDNKCTGGSCINLIMSILPGHCPIIKIYAQYWILDKSGFGLQFSDSFDIIGKKPDPESLRQSFLAPNIANNNTITSDLTRQGCEWSMGMNGMTLYFSKKERVSFSVVHDEEVMLNKTKRKFFSRWSSFIDISKATLSKTMISVDDHDGKKRFELAYSVAPCPSIFSRTLMITFFPRYQIANLLQQPLFVAQDGASVHHLIPSQNWVPFHWEDSAMQPKIRLACHVDSKSGSMWTQGCIALDQIGITAMRIPTMRKDKTVIVQVEVRLATKKQSSAVVVVIWSSILKSNPLYTLRNESLHTIFCSQPLVQLGGNENAVDRFDCSSNDIIADVQQDNTTGALGRIARKHYSNDSNLRESKLKSIINEVQNVLQCNGCNALDQINENLGCEEFIWALKPGESIGFGFDDPELVPHVLEYTCLSSSALLLHGDNSDIGRIELDDVGAKSSVMLLDGDEIKCTVKAEQSTKVIVFSDSKVNDEPTDDLISLILHLEFPCITVSIIDNMCQLEQDKRYSLDTTSYDKVPKEIILITTEGWLCSFSQTKEGFHEFEIKLDVLHADNFIFNAEHPVLIHAPKIENEPFLHCSIVRRLNYHDSTFIISYAALRVLEIDISFDRKTAETLANFFHPLWQAREQDINTDAWIKSITLKMTSNYSKGTRRAPREVEKMIHSANSGRIYVENLQLHPLRLTVTFTQEWIDSNLYKPEATEGLLIYQLIRGTTSITDAPLTFDSFLVGNAFESPLSLLGIILAHYNSQLTSQIIPLLFNMAILKAPVEFVSNVGTGVIRFFYEPINGKFCVDVYFDIVDSIAIDKITL